jgi:hypothetical protein
MQMHTTPTRSHWCKPCHPSPLPHPPPHPPHTPNHCTYALYIVSFTREHTWNLTVYPIVFTFDTPIYATDPYYLFMLSPAQTFSWYTNVDDNKLYRQLPPCVALLIKVFDDNFRQKRVLMQQSRFQFIVQFKTKGGLDIYYIRSQAPATWFINYKQYCNVVCVYVCVCVCGVCVCMCLCVCVHDKNK